MTVDKAYELLFSFAFLAVGVCILLSIIRSAMGPKITDRLLCVNMNTTMVVSLIVWLVIFLGEDWLADVALVYVLLGTVGTAVLAKVYVKDPDASEGRKSKPSDRRGAQSDRPGNNGKEEGEAHRE